MELERVRSFLNDVGDLIGRYEIVRVLGEGGTAVVYEAVDPQLERRVAVKILKEGNLERLRQEAAAAARLKHPGIVALHEIGPDYIVMDLVAGRTLAEALPSLSLGERLRILEEVARAVHYAHGQGVVHRDLKPGNVLVQEDGRPVLTDFGLARIADGRNLTLPGAAMGTPQYMAPEQGGKGTIGPSVDVWALGVMLYEIVSDRLPFTGETPMAIFEQVLSHRPAPVDGPAQAVVERALARDPRQRYPTAEAFAEDVARLRAGQVVRRRRRLVPHLLGTLALVTIAAVLLRRDREPPPPVLPTPPPAAVAPAPPNPEVALLERWRYDERDFSARLEKDPTDVELLIDRARVRRFRAEHDEGSGRNAEPDYAAAESDMKRALAIDPTSRPARLQLGILLLSRAQQRAEHGIDPTADIVAAERALAAAGNEIAARTYKGVARLQRALWRQRRGLDARGDLEAADALLTPPEYQRALMFRARVRGELGRFAESEQDFEAYFEAQKHSLQEETYRVWEWRGLIRIKAGDVAGADRCFTKAVALNRENAKLLLRRAELRFSAGRFREASADYDRAFAINPTLEVIAGVNAREAARRSAAP